MALKWTATNMVKNSHILKTCSWGTNAIRWQAVKPQRTECILSQDFPSRIPLISVYRIKPLIDCQSPPSLSKATREALFWNTKDIISISSGVTEHPVRSGTCRFRSQCLSFITNKTGTTLLYLKQHWYTAPTEKGENVFRSKAFAQSSSM